MRVRFQTGIIGDFIFLVWKHSSEIRFSENEIPLLLCYSHSFLKIEYISEKATFLAVSTLV